MEKFLETRVRGSDKDGFLKVDHHEIPENSSDTYSVILYNQEGSTKKNLLKCAIELTSGIFSRLSLERKEYNEPNITREDLDLKSVHIMRETASLLGYMRNCSSFLSDELKSYDKEEMLRKLKRIEYLLK